MIASLRTGGEERRRRLEQALNTLYDPGCDLPDLARKIAASKTTWLVAGPVDRLDQRYKAPPTPTDFTVIATDGSHIDVDRHRSTRCYLVNIGSVLLRYGASANATLDSLPHLYSEDEDLVITHPTARGREQPIEGALLGIKRGVEECRRLAELATEAPPDIPTLALLDGSLILWGLEAYPEFVTESLLNQGFLRHLDGMMKLSNQQIALASYISFPRSTDVVNALRVALCPNEVVDSDRYCSSCTTRDCDVVAGVQDRELFSNLLEPGERSALFISQSSVVRKHYAVHQVYFFYLRVGDETARIEVPGWVATDEKRLNLVHVLVLDQCQRGQGYPVALSEAHEKAVVTGADRDQFWQLVESSLVEEHLPSLGSAKSLSKRTRWV
jgi:hypothetical protein